MATGGVPDIRHRRARSRHGRDRAHCAIRRSTTSRPRSNGDVSGFAAQVAFARIDLLVRSVRSVLPARANFCGAAVTLRPVHSSTSRYLNVIPRRARAPEPIEKEIRMAPIIEAHGLTKR